jgi:hypothetical protein
MRLEAIPLTLGALPIIIASIEKSQGTPQRSCGGEIHGKKPGCPDLWSGRNGQRGFGGGSPQGLFPWKKPRPVAGVLHSVFGWDLSTAWLPGKH